MSINDQMIQSNVVPPIGRSVQPQSVSSRNFLYQQSKWKQYLWRYDRIYRSFSLNIKPFICIDYCTIFPCPRIVFKMKFCVYEKNKSLVTTFRPGIRNIRINRYGTLSQVILLYKLYIGITRYYCIFWLAFSVLSSEGRWTNEHFTYVVHLIFKSIRPFYDLQTK